LGTQNKFVAVSVHYKDLLNFSFWEHQETWKRIAHLMVARANM